MLREKKKRETTGRIDFWSVNEGREGMGEDKSKKKDAPDFVIQKLYPCIIEWKDGTRECVPGFKLDSYKEKYKWEFQLKEAANG